MRGFDGIPGMAESGLKKVGLDCAIGARTHLWAEEFGKLSQVKEFVALVEEGRAGGHAVIVICVCIFQIQMHAENRGKHLASQSHDRYPSAKCRCSLDPIRLGLGTDLSSRDDKFLSV